MSSRRIQDLSLHSIDTFRTSRTSVGAAWLLPDPRTPKRRPDGFGGAIWPPFDQGAASKSGQKNVEPEVQACKDGEAVARTSALSAEVFTSVLE